MTVNWWKVAGLACIAGAWAAVLLIAMAVYYAIAKA